MKKDPDASLLERSSELSVLGDLVTDLQRGNGAVVAITGVAGIGKSTLLEAGVEMARASGHRVLVARADELGSNSSWAVVRDLLQPVHRERGAGPAEGPAANALRVLDAAVDGDTGHRDAFAVVNGLYWLVADLSETDPLLIAVDDLQWCDLASARWLVYLAERLAGLRIGLLVSWRSGEPIGDESLTARFEIATARSSVSPSAFSTGAVEAVLERHLGHHPSRDLVDACHELTAGNPFLVTELAGALSVDHATGDALALAQVRDLAPTSVRRSTSLRIGRLGREAAELASAVAVLGDGAQLVHAAALAGIPLDGAARAADALASMGIFQSGTPLRFTHALVRAAIYDDIPPVVRRLHHANAARVLADHLAGDELVCAQVLRCEPGAYPDAVEHLSSGAVQALGRGTPEVAVRLLSRALEEPLHTAERRRLLHRLGRAEALLRTPAAAEHLEAALALAPEDAEVADIAADLSEVLGFHGRWTDGLVVAEAAIARVAPSFALESLPERGSPFERLEYFWAGLAAFDPTRIDRFDSFVERQRAAGASQSAQGAALLAVSLAWRGEAPDEIRSLLDSALADLTPHAMAEAEPMMLMRVCASTFVTDDVARAEKLVGDLFTASRSEGSLFPLMLGLTYRTALRARRGELVGAADDLREAFDLSVQNELRFGIPPLLWYGADALIEREELSDIAALVEVIDLGPDLDRLAVGAIFREVRGRLALAEMRFDDARRHLAGVRAVFDPMRLHNPNGSSWRSALALSLAGEDPDEALALVRTELADARRLGWPRPIGVALRTLGLVEGGEAGLAHLGESVDVLSATGARLERARALVSLGSALRRANRRSDARPPLLAGLDLAQRCGAERLAASAREELIASGARPRRAAITGRESLTAAERRVAELAAQKMTNREIAQALFVTVNTVEGHLKQVFQKLSISSRREISAGLDRAAPEP